ncbi:MAG: ABC transporter permease [Prevotellaceae bacterium]|nr:ABC transporter permease [Prevotellaceae bacterium]
MFDLDSLNEIWVTITRNKARSFLTAFGVFWGIFMLMIMLGAGSGLEYGMKKEIAGIATNSCFMRSSSTSLPYKGFQKGRQWSIHNHDLEVLRVNIPEIDCLSPVLFGGRSNNNVAYGENTGSYNVQGLKPNYAEIERQRMLYGRFVNEIDEIHSRKVCVIGTQVFEELFPQKENPVGKYIRVNNVYYQVVGVSEGVSNISISGSSQETIIVPFSTLQKISNQGNTVHMLAATTIAGASVKAMENEIKTVLKRNNKINPADEQALWSFNLEEQFNIFKYTLIATAVLIWVVGSGTLIAGAVGVSNIMLVTVNERTKEIGIRRALGAKPAVITLQIIMETLVLTLIAGLLGIAVGVLCLHLADVLWLQEAENMFLKNPVVSFNMAIVSTFILLFFGLLAGLIPARRALHIKAIEAIREE